MFKMIKEFLFGKPAVVEIPKPSVPAMTAAAKPQVAVAEVLKEVVEVKSAEVVEVPEVAEELPKEWPFPTGKKPRKPRAKKIKPAE